MATVQFCNVRGEPQGERINLDRRRRRLSTIAKQHANKRRPFMVSVHQGGGHDTEIALAFHRPARVNVITPPPAQAGGFFFPDARADPLNFKKTEPAKNFAGLAAHNFVVSEYIDPTGRKLRSFDMTKDGFTFLVMGFTGSTAARCGAGSMTIGRVSVAPHLDQLIKLFTKAL